MNPGNQNRVSFYFAFEFMIMQQASSYDIKV